MYENSLISSTFDGVIQVTKSETNNPVIYTLHNKRTEKLVTIKFQDGAPCPIKGPNGLTVEDTINVVIHRISHLNDCLPSERNIAAIGYLKQALEELTLRLHERT